ncbi:hypothetical protein SAMN05216276_1008176 [Streptosporangium subroseum]|uniref:Uncharacterized protein n=1 Tax=Streptosporangium subroseum TaxID=106412 RepID=A0A239E1F9_9ACTN|nr:hypothetical protein [Streptosporangium subroseum]SNS38526.1 hypothetical protein SAMN05216276_1008176 [Streptosporangium subroseum]
MFALVATGLLAASALSTATAAVADATPTPTPSATQAAAAPTVPSAAAVNECGKLTLTFNNPTRFAYTFDYRVDDQRPKHPPVVDATIKEGPLAGQKFGPRYNLVKIDGVGTKTVTLPFKPNSGYHKVEWRLAEGPEQKQFLPWASATVQTSCKAVTVAPEFKQPRCSDKAAHIVIGNTPGVRYSYGFKALNAGDNVVKAGSKGYVTARATSPAVKLRGKTTWPIAFDQAPSAYTCS